MKNLKELRGHFSENYENQHFLKDGKVYRVVGGKGEGVKKTKLFKENEYCYKYQKIIYVDILTMERFEFNYPVIWEELLFKWINNYRRAKQYFAKAMEQ
tara:strand:+ start:247 stop:543 length:297 start_codon:yes stop_codon:yes gene_type:complete